MKLFGRFVPTAAAGLLVLFTAPLAATHIPEYQVRQGDTFTTQVVFTPQQPAAFTGGVRIAPGTNAIVAPGTPSRQATLSSLGFQANSSASFRTEGSQLKLAIGGQGQNQILIGLSLPSVQPSSVQKAREAAVAPAK